MYFWEKNMEMYIHLRTNPLTPTNLDMNGIFQIKGNYTILDWYGFSFHP